MQFGVKLATGSFDNDFIAGPQQGRGLDRGLQPGTGTTDLLVGAFTFGALSRDWDFAQGMLQQPLNSRDGFAGHRPEPQRGLPVHGDRGSHAFAADQRAHRGSRVGDRTPTSPTAGASLVYLSPGLNLQVTERLHGYAFFQVPVYQRVNGLQLEPRYTATIGIYLHTM